MYKFLPLRARLLYATARNAFSTQNRHILPYIVNQNDIELLRYLIDHGINVNAANACGATALHVASNRGYIPIVKLLLDNNANTNLQTENHVTPLHIAAFNGYTDIVRLLLNHESNVDAEDDWGNTALHFASNRGYIPIVKLLLDNNANTNLQTENHVTPLHIAAFNGYTDIVRLLLNHESNVDAANALGNTALHFASERGHIPIVKLLLDNNANTNPQNENHNTPLHIATFNGHIDIIRLLLNYESDVNLLNRINETALRVAWIKYTNNQSEKHLEVVKLLVAHFVKIEQANLVYTSHSLGFIQNKRLISESEELKELEQQCHKEIEEMKSIPVGKNCTSFFDIFVLQKDKKVLTRCANNPNLVKCKNKFSMYSSFIEKTIEEGKARAKMLQGAAESMDEIFESNHDANQEGQTSWPHLPPEVRLMILENLNNDDLTKLQQNEEAEAGTAGAEVEDEVAGAHAIYEGE
ncbi:ankyrin repeat domain-containing protein [Orientia tsutsugamushi]|uniref:ankyrin repeat domain-containing protein n=1 Tax=Orientia tsutsugamushi TaxID=784 RepID=UPI003526D38E